MYFRVSACRRLDETQFLVRPGLVFVFNEVHLQGYGRPFDIALPEVIIIVCNNVTCGIGYLFVFLSYQLYSLAMIPDKLNTDTIMTKHTTTEINKQPIRDALNKYDGHCFN